MNAINEFSQFWEKILLSSVACQRAVICNLSNMLMNIYIVFFSVLVHFQFVFHLKESKEYHNYLIHLLTIIQQQILNKLFVFSIFYLCLSKYILNLIAMIIRMVRTMYACLYVILTFIYKTATNVDDQTTKKAFTLKLYVF